LSARLATSCLVFAALSTAIAQSAAPSDSELVVYLRGAAAQPAAPIRYMKAEVEAIMHRAGYEVAWRTANESTDAPFLAVVDFSGWCAPGPASPIHEETNLASTSITDGRVLPFSRIDCSALTRAIGGVGDVMYGQAMARVLAHELYHVLAQTTHHGRDGIAKACFRISDLLAARFEFEENIRSQLRRLHGSPAVVAPSDEEVGRSRDPRPDRQ
jgi:hypothetical protein